MDKWRSAVVSAEDGIRPNREELYLMYDYAMEDDQLTAQIRTAHMNICMGDFEVRVNDEADEDLTKLLDKPWMLKYLAHVIDAEFYGHSLIEMRQKDGKIYDVVLVPREHVNPWTRQIIAQPSDDKGISYDKGPLRKQVIEVGSWEDLGLLKVISKLIVRKNYCIVDWGRRNEKFGVPFIVLQTSDVDAGRLDAKQKYLENLGSSGWAIVGADDEFTIKEAIGNSGGGHLSFKDFITYCDKNVAFTVNGQISNAESVAYAANADAQERQLNKYTLARMRRIQYHINEVLLPWLVEHTDSYPVADAQFVFLDLETNEEEVTIDTDNTVTEEKQDQDSVKTDE
jgi:hypothetical protein